MTFLLANALGIVIGIVLKTLVPMPFIDQPVRDGWSWLANTINRL